MAGKATLVLSLSHQVLSGMSNYNKECVSAITFDYSTGSIITFLWIPGIYPTIFFEISENMFLFYLLSHAL